uniref:Neurotransmitter-gated ion-channel ligand-binding domain-containing protein n=1 Tax=Anopheles stephensi TaxID=30069 RepID=A0A182YPU2_ANOST
MKQCTQPAHHTHPNESRPTEVPFRDHFRLTVCMAGYNEKRLLHDLLDSYNILERPVVNESDPLQLSFGLTLMQIIDVILAV